MKKNIVVVLLFVFLLSIAIGCSKQESTPPTPTSSQNVGGGGSAESKNVVIADFAFSPSTLTVKKGDTVIWINEDAVPHTVTSDSGSELASETLASRATFEHTFDSAGTFEYHCGIHQEMTGIVIVQ